jgi:hypothetical protein
MEASLLKCPKKMQSVLLAEFKVEQDDIHVLLFKQAEGVVAGSDVSHQLEARLGFEQTRQTLAEEGVIVN